MHWLVLVYYRSMPSRGHSHQLESKRGVPRPCQSHSNAKHVRLRLRLRLRIPSAWQGEHDTNPDRSQPYADAQLAPQNCRRCFSEAKLLVAIKMF